ncbi:MAG: N-acetyltransferase [Deltaproteobacteria bacterium]|nr:N-acetyltransferase [Deltaproteobacteria bacterium]
MTASVTIRPAIPTDLAPLTEILNFYVRETAITFDEQLWEPEQKRAWFDTYEERGPYRMLIAEEGERVLGVAYSSCYREHPAFRETVEASIYLAPYARTRGVGSRLYSALFDALASEPVHRAVVGIALPNDASIALHRKFGFREIGVFNEYAIKRGVRISSVWMEKAIRGSF